MTVPMKHSGNPASELTLGGRRFQVRRVNRKQREALERYAADRTPQPLLKLIERAKAADDSKGQLYQDIVKSYIGPAMREQDEWPPRFGSDAFRRFFLREENVMHLLGVILTEDNDITEDEVEALCRQAAEDDPEQYDIDIININRRFYCGADKPLTIADIKRMEQRERESQAEAIAGAVGTLKNAAARLAPEAGPAGSPSDSPTPSGGESPEPLRGSMAGRQA